jgi:uncharacterized protein (TIGR03083 family)
MNGAATIDERCDVLGTAWEWWAATLASLDDDQWRSPTRLESWDVAALVAHHAQLVRALGAFARHPVDETPATATAAAMLRRFNEPSGVAHTYAGAVAERARQMAAAEGPDVLRAVFTAEAPSSIATARQVGPIVIQYVNQGPFPLAEALSIIVLEAVAHGLDLARAVDHAPDLPPAALEFTAHLLADVADPVPFIEAATGRAPVDVLPVIR